MHASSLGKLTGSWLQSFYGACAIQNKYNIAENFRIIFPTDKCVQTSHLGIENANSIFLNPTYWEKSSDFPKECFYKLESSAPQFDGNLFHSKIIIVNDKNTNEIDDYSMLYFGSHNFSPSAWGTKHQKKDLIYMSNWELGVVFPPEHGSMQMKR